MKNPKKVFLSTAFIGTGVLFLLLWKQWNWKCYWAWWTGLSVVTLFVYGFDKAQSRRDGGQRVPEVVLHVLALAGGVAGAWVGRAVFRHKTLHLRFTVVLIAATVVHVGLWVVFVWK